MRYRSDIRESQIRNLHQRVEDADYRKYLQEMTLHKLRAFEGARIRFRFPVTALIGPNGGGKSTILGAAALIYKSAKPSIFFAQSSADREAMRGIRVSYRLIDRDHRRDGEIERSVTHPDLKWSREALERRLLFFGVRRTVPANERPEFSKFRLGTEEIRDEDYASLSPAVIEAASRILGIDLSSYARSHSQSAKKPLLGYADRVRFSEFHFGAGLSVIIELVWNLENLNPQEQALVLIEEVENTLHPFAVRKFVEYLITVAERKRCQIIFTTHSEYALDPLPREAIWAARNGQLLNGRLRVEDMLAFRGDIETRLAVYCEDNTARDWLQEMMRFSGNTLELNQIEFYAVGSYANVVEVTRQHNNNPASRFKAIGFVDGDTPSYQKLEPDTYRLPGTLMPEEVILDTVRQGYSTNLGILTVRLTGKPEEQERIRRLIDEVALQTEDMHLLFSKIGVRLGFLPEETVRLAFMSAFCTSLPEVAREISQIICGHLPVNGNGH